MKKALIGFAIAPLLPAVLWLPVMLVYQALTTDVSDIVAHVANSMRATAPSIYVAAVVQTYAVALGLGFPLYLLVAKLGLLRLWIVAVIGVLLPILAIAGFYLYQILYQPASNTKATGTFQSLLSMLQQHHALLVAYAVLGLLAAGLLWFFIRRRGDVVTINLDDDWEVTEKL